LRKYAYTAWARYEPGMNAPKLDVNCVQFVTSFGSFCGPFSAKPTKAATAVPTPSIGFEPDDCSST
jgi:hypothetical protein